MPTGPPPCPRQVPACSPASFSLNRSISAGGNWVYSLAISADGHTLAAGAADLYTFNLTTGKPLLRVPIAGGAQAVAFSPDMETIAAGSWDGRIALVDRASGLLVRNVTGHNGTVGALAWTPDGKTLISSGNNAIHYINVATGKVVRNVTVVGGMTRSMALSRDGKTLVSGW
jgi:WD40 repeat protein